MLGNPKAWDSTGPAFFAKLNFAFFMTIASLLIYFLVLASQNLLRVLLLSNIPIAIYNFLIEWQVYFFLQFLTIFLHFFCKLLPKSFHNFLAIFFAIFLQTLAKKSSNYFLSPGRFNFTQLKRFTVHRWHREQCFPS